MSDLARLRIWARLFKTHTSTLVQPSSQILRNKYNSCLFASSKLGNLSATASQEVETYLPIISRTSSPISFNMNSPPPPSSPWHSLLLSPASQTRQYHLPLLMETSTSRDIAQELYDSILGLQTISYGWKWAFQRPSWRLRDAPHWRNGHDAIQIGLDAM